MQGLFEQALDRLESVASRLEASEARLSGAAPPTVACVPQSSANAGPAVPAAAKSHPVAGCSITAPAFQTAGADSVAAYDELVMPALRALVGSGATLGPDVGKATQIIDKAFQVSPRAARPFSTCNSHVRRSSRLYKWRPLYGFRGAA